MLNTLKQPLEQLNLQLDEINDFIGRISSLDISRSTVSYNAVIISLYGCYENYVDSLIEELICQISDNSSNYTEIPTDMRISNIHLSSDYLNSKQRYKNFNLKDEDVINNIYSGKITNKLLLKHGGNLSITVLADYMKSLGIKNIAQSIRNCNEFYRYYSELQAISVERAKLSLQKLEFETVFSPLCDLISQRNAIAHSWKSDDKVDYTIIKNEWIKFIRVFCKCLNNIVVQFYLEWLVNHNKLFCPKRFKIFGSSTIGFYDVVPHYDARNDTIVIKLNDRIHIGKISSVMIHKDHEVSMKIDNFSLKKEKSEKYSFYFDKAILDEFQNISEYLEETPTDLEGIQIT